MGKRALFWAKPEAAQEGEGPPAAPPLGKHALFSGAPRSHDELETDPTLNPVVRSGPITVECQRCRAVSRIGFLDLLIYQFPVGYWLPRGKYDHKMSCPVCRRRTWASVTLRHRR
jgi:hypothetical protein